MSYTDDPTEISELKQAMKEELRNFDPYYEPDEYMSDHITDRYESGDPYTDKFGVAIPDAFETFFVYRCFFGNFLHRLRL